MNRRSLLGRTILATVVFLLACAATNAVSQAGAASPAIAPVNPDASPEARALLKYLYSISGHYTLSGQHNYPYHIARWTDRAYDLTGKYPAVFGQDFGFQGDDDKDSTEARPFLIEEIKRQYRNGAVPTLTWHSVRPSSDEPVTFKENVQSHLSDFEWSELLTPGTTLNNRWCTQVDVIAGYLKQLREARVPVLFRPYHEMNGRWFWWGGRPGQNGSMALYRQLFDRFVNYHKLNNLIWVWNANVPNGGAGPLADYFPGTQFADVVSVDNYEEFTQSRYDDALALAAGKLIALGEVGTVPSPAVLKQQPKWAWFMVWSEFVEEGNSLEAVRAIYDAPMTLNRDDPRLAGPMAAIRKASAPPSPTPVTPQAMAEAKALLARLYSVSGQSVLSGQENSPQSVAGSTEKVFQITGKYPAIYGEDLGIARGTEAEVSAARQAIVDEAKRRYKAQSIVSLTWHATRPTDDEPGNGQQSLLGKLSDFEWNELFAPGTRLNQRWSAQVDAVAGYLKQLQDAGIPVLWRPYPEPNGNDFWWVGRKESHDAAALYRQLFERLVNHDGVHNLIWVWNVDVAGASEGGNGPYSDFFPGLLYVDALEANQVALIPHWRSDTPLALMGVGKVIGVALTAVPDPATLAQQNHWAWFLISADTVGTAAGAAGSSEMLKKLYDDPRVVSGTSGVAP